MNLFESILSKAKTNFANPDPTQNLQFKAIQGAANLYTGVAEEAAMGGQRDFERRKEVAKQFLSSKGYAPDVIESTLSQIEYKPGFLGRVREGIGARMQEAGKTTERLADEGLNLKTAITAPVSYAGDVVGAAFEPVGAAISPLVQKGIEKSGLTEEVQSLGESWSDIKQNYPNFADLLEGSANVAGILPGTYGAGTLLKKGGKEIVRGAEKVAPKVVQGIKKMTPTLPKAEDLLVKQLEKTNRMNPTKYSEFEQIAGQRAGKFLADRGITGDAESNVAKLYENFTKSKSEADKGLSAIDKTYKPSEVPTAFNDMLGELEKRFTYTKDNANLAKVKEYKAKLENGTLSHNDINGTKRLYEQKVKVNYIKDQNSLEVERATNIDNDVRNWQFDEADKLGFGNLKEINKETQLNRFLADNIGDKIARGAGLNNISLTDWIIAGQVPATPEAFALLVGKKFAEKAIPKLYQKGLEKIAKIPKKKAPIADIENISKMEQVRKSVTPQYDTNRLLVPPRNSSRSPATITPEITLPTGEKALPTKKSPAIKSDITSKSKIVRPSVKPSPQVKPVEKTVKENKTVSKLEDYITSKIPEIENISDGTIYFKDGSKGELTMGTDWGKPQIIAIEVPNKRAGMGTKIINAMKEWSIGAGHNEIRLNNNVSPKFWEKMGFKGEGPNKYYDTKWIASQEDIINFKKNQPKPLSPQKTVKPLTPKKESTTIGDMETKKLIEEARKYKSAEEFVKAQLQPDDVVMYNGNVVTLKNFGGGIGGNKKWSGVDSKGNKIVNIDLKDVEPYRFSDRYGQIDVNDSLKQLSKDTSDIKKKYENELAILDNYNAYKNKGVEYKVIDSILSKRDTKWKEKLSIGEKAKKMIESKLNNTPDFLGRKSMQELKQIYNKAKTSK